MVAAAFLGAAARLLPDRGCGRPPLLDLPRRANRRRPRRGAQLVHPRTFRLMPDNVSSRMRLVRRDDMPPPPIAPAPFVELGVTTPFSFLRGASDADSLVLTALRHGMDAIGIADRNTLAGVVRLH